ncbi:multidrug resistance-associated protein [Trichoderma atroviride IMI 206040]|uniref:Multidrug resistance-associated protein n=1 Tax=Hypocrea atroviridis (strain ATCC 20476 / IMI 206040) TaxID=452589 RepID=G9NTJ0_HYPAI|nr:multidrug resistance-associated protein [Trichoderma atroviride IMI 206040]EHK46031.1 multidrug resistance-associated protein [Trichoderma atroviride IMI 206040]
MDYFSCPNDATFGPAVHGCNHREFDFTLRFEAIFFSILPAAIFIILALVRSIWLVKEPVIVKGRIYQLSKAAFIAICIALRFSSFVLSIVWRGEQAALFISSAALDVVAISLALPLSFLEHARSPRPSMLLSSYLWLSLLFDIVRTRSFWLLAVTHTEHAFAAVFTAAVGVKAVAFLAESQTKTRWIQWDTASHSPEETAGFFGLAAFSWVWKLFAIGRQKVLSLEDLFSLDRHMASDTLRMKLHTSIKVSSTHGHKHGLAKALAKSLLGSFLLPIPPRLALSAFRFCQPFLINSLLSYLLIPASERPVNYGYGLIVATFLVYGGIAVSTSIYYYLRERTIWMARGALASVIYEQTLRSRLSVVGDSSVLTLMSTDIERTRQGFMAMHEFWASFLETGVALWLLYRELGVAFVAPIVVVSVCVVSVTIASRLSGPRQNLWMQKIQERVGALSHVVANMKTLKIAGLAESAEALIQRLREVEIGIGGSWRMTIVLFVIIGFAPSMLGPLFTFAVTSRTLDTTRVFTALSFLVLLTEPLSQIFQYVPFMMASFQCLTRIQNFLEEECCIDFREDAGPAQFKYESKEDDLRRSIGEDCDAIIQVCDGSFGWDKEKLVLSKLSFSIAANSLTIVIGPTACGKSTLLKALLGETPIHDGRVLIEPAARRIGYCDQTPFLTNASVRENILGYSSFDENRYNEVLEATMLLPDLALLPQGDLTKIGSNGVSLSGGQKQRVSMARALYSDSKLFLFDDTLSGLDADTEEQVFQRVFATNGLIRRRNATAVLSTHAVRHLPSADHIVALNHDGLIVEQGIFDDLDSLGGYVQSLEVQVNKKPSENLPSDSSSVLSTAEKSEESAVVTARTPPPAMWSATDEHSRKTRDWSVYKHYAGSMKSITLLSFLLVGIALGFFFNFPQIWLNFWSADVTSAHRAHSQAYWIGIYSFFQVLSLACIGIICAILFISMTAQSGTALHHQTLRTVIRAPLRFFTTVDAGIVTNLFSQDISLVDIELPQALLNVMAELCMSIGMAVVVATASPYIAISYPFVVALMWLIQNVYLSTSRQLRLLDLETKSPLYTHFTDTVTGVATLRAFGWAQESLGFNLGLLDNSQRPAYLLAMVQHCLTFFLSAVVTVLATLVVVLVTQVKAVTGAGFAGASMVSLMSLGDYVSNLIRMYTLLEISIGAVSRLKSFRETVLPESSPEEDAMLPPLWPLHGSLEIKDVSASYNNELNQSLQLEDSDGTDATDLVLRNVSMSIAPGEKIAICGRSGSGKSSFLLLLLRLLDPLPACADGITIDNVSLNRVNRSILRQRVIAVPQDSIFFPDGHSFRTNLDPYNLSTDSDCTEVLQSVGLWQAVEDNGGLNGSLSTSMLSHGQRQLFGFARAILRRRIRGSAARDIGGLLLLDEVGSSVDKDTDRTIQRLIRDEFTRYTTIAISHRLDAIMDFDRVIVMDKGRVVESGRPRELVKRDEGAFKSLWTAGGREI